MTLPRLNACAALLLALLYVAWWIRAGAAFTPLHVTLLLLAAAPLFALAPALWHGQRFGTALAGVVVPFHFAWAVMELVANPAVRGWVAAQSFLALLLFVGSMSTLRQARS